MTQQEARRHGPGLYRLYWKSGGVSEASVGVLCNGQMWFAPTNWTATHVDGVASRKWALIDHIEKAD